MKHTTDSVSMTPQIACPQCGVIDTPAVGPGSGPHTARARWAHCGRFVPWVSTRSPEERQARRQQARQAAMAEASASIDAALGREGVRA